MTKKDILEELLKVLSTKKEAKDAVDKVFNVMTSAILKREKIVISNFGSFYVKLSPARKVKIPKIDKTILIQARPRIRFIPSKNIFKNNGTLSSR